MRPSGSTASSRTRPCGSKVFDVILASKKSSRLLPYPMKPRRLKGHTDWSPVCKRVPAHKMVMMNATAAGTSTLVILAVVPTDGLRSLRPCRVEHVGEGEGARERERESAKKPEKRESLPLGGGLECEEEEEEKLEEKESRRRIATSERKRERERERDILPCCAVLGAVSCCAACAVITVMASGHGQSVMHRHVPLRFQNQRRERVFAFCLFVCSWCLLGRVR